MRHALRQLLARCRQPLAHQLAGAVNVCGPVKTDVHKRQARAGDRARTFNPRNPRHRDFQRNGDQLLDLLRGHAARLGLHRDGRLVEVGKYIDLQTAQREAAVEHQHQRSHQDQQPVAQ